MNKRPVGKPRVERLVLPLFGGLWRFEVLDIQAHRFTVGYCFTWQEAIRAAINARDCIATGSGEPAAPPDPAEFNGGCGRDGCNCGDHTRWPVCGEWIGIDGETGPGCPRCGWSRRVHTTNQSYWIDGEMWCDPDCIECDGEGAPCCEPPSHRYIADDGPAPDGAKRCPEWSQLYERQCEQPAGHDCWHGFMWDWDDPGRGAHWWPGPAPGAID